MAKIIDFESINNKFESLSSATVYVPKDWKNENNYDYTSNHTRELWAWEFLRRNLKYHKDWDKVVAIYLENKKKNIPHIKAVLKNKEKFCFVPGHSKDFYINELSARKKTWMIKFLNYYLNEDKVPNYLPFEQARSKWQLLVDNIINPNIDKPSSLESLGENNIDPLTGKSNDEFNIPLFYQSGLLFIKDHFNILQKIGIKNSEAVVLFDLTKPIKQQYERIENELKKEQNKFLPLENIQVRNNKDKNDIRKRYIRILDAKYAKIKSKDIASIIFPKTDNKYNNGFLGTKRVDASLRRAQMLVNGDYLNILQNTSTYQKVYKY